MTQQSVAIDRFRELHESGCFVLPNPWDVGSAIYLAQVGFKALATTSAGYAFAQGLPDGGVALEKMLEHFREIAAATSLPVNADFQNCFADDPESVAANVRACVATGVAGLSIEDSTGNSGKPLYEFKLAIERVKAARAAIDEVSLNESAGNSNSRVLLTARCEAFLVGDPDAMRTSLDRLVAFAEAGADCLYAPGITKPDEISAIVKAVAPKPINVLVYTKNCHLTLKQLADLGVRRISLGGSLARAAWTGVVTTAKEIQDAGTFTSLAEVTMFDFNKLFREQSHER
jgi:2-methylisocitrate lyase-like PEP mutase family enzyme